MPTASRHWLQVNRYSVLQAAYLLLGLEPEGKHPSDAPQYVEALYQQLLPDARELCQARLMEQLGDHFLDHPVFVTDYRTYLLKEDLSFFAKCYGIQTLPTFFADDAEKPLPTEKNDSPFEVVAEAPLPTEKDGTPFEVVAEKTYLNIIKGLLDLVLRDTDDRGQPLCPFRSQNQVIAHLVDRNPLLRGVADRTLRKAFAKANAEEGKSRP